jgi:hypothetical protein
MATRARTTGATDQRTDEAVHGARSEGSQAQSAPRAGGARTATVNLPFMTAQFRAPDVHVPSRDELAGAARGAWSLVPSRGTALFVGGLVVTAVAGVIEWPVAAAIGVGTALARSGGEQSAQSGRPAERNTTR